MSEENADSDMIKSLSIPDDCKTDIEQLSAVVQRRAEKSARPTKGFLTRIPPVYGCDRLAAHSIDRASKESSAAFSSNTEDYTWNIVVFFRGRPTIGNTPTLMIPIVVIGSLTVRVDRNDDKIMNLDMAGQYHLFHKEHTLNIEGDGRMAALCITAVESS